MPELRDVRDVSIPRGIAPYAAAAPVAWPPEDTYDGEIAVKVRNRHTAAVTLTVRTFDDPDTDSTLVVAAAETVELLMRKIDHATNLAGALDIFTARVKGMPILE